MSDEQDDPTEKPLRKTLEETLPILSRGKAYHADLATQYGHAEDLIGNLLKLTDQVAADRFQQFAPGFEKFRLFAAAREVMQLPYNPSSGAISVTGTSTVAMTFTEFPEVRDFVKVHLKPLDSWDIARAHKYADKLSRLDAELGSYYRGITEAFFGLRENSERSAFGLARQCFDHLFAVLAPNDDEVRKSSFFRRKTGDKPDAVSRVERIKFVAATQIRDKTQADFLIEQAAELVATYGELQKLHAREAIERERARVILLTFMASIEQWADALQL